MSGTFKLSFTLFEMPLTLNEVMGKSWRSRHENFKRIKKAIYLHSVGKLPPQPIKKARVSFIRYSSGTLDRDNLYFTFKSIIDGLVQSGVILDDGFEMVKELYPAQVKIKRTEKKKIEVTVEELA